MELREGWGNSKREEINWKTTTIKLRGPQNIQVTGLKPTACTHFTSTADFAVFKACFQVFSWEAEAEPVTGQEGTRRVGPGLTCMDSTGPTVTQGLCFHL